jgi:hypothetical protein
MRLFSIGECVEKRILSQTVDMKSMGCSSMNIKSLKICMHLLCK